jgi:hypothetical protein
VEASGRGRPPVWCSQACRRGAYEERKAAAAGAIAVRVVERETVIERVRTRLREPTVQDCVLRVLASPRACREVVNGLAMLAERGGMDSSEHKATVAAIHRLGQVMVPGGT